MFDSLFPKHWTTLQRLMWLKTNALARAVYETITGNPVSFTAKAAPLKQLEVAFSPVQDLHGYDSPWPAGGGVNKLPKMVDGTYEGNGVKAVVVNGVATLSGTTTASGNAFIIPLEEEVTIPVGTTFYYHLLNSVANGGLVPSIEPSNSTAHALTYAATPANRITGQISARSEDLVYGRVRFWFTSGVTISGTYAPMLCLDNTARSYSPYSNLCPISGWDSLTVEQRGKNLLNPESATAIEAKVGNDIVTRYGYEFTAPATYAIKCYATGGSNYLYGVVKKADGTWGNVSYRVAGGNATAVKVTITSGETLKVFDAVESPSLEASIAKFENWKMAIALDDYLDAYVPYNPSSRSISITIGQTVYGGTVDVVTGVGEIDWVSVDMGELSWRYITNDGDPYFRAGPNNRKTGYNNLLCSLFKVMQSSGTTRLENAAIVGSTSGNYVFARWFAYTDAAAFKTAVTGQTLVYELATPIPIQLTPQEVESLAGDNTMWTDAASLEVTYRSN